MPPYELAAVLLLALVVARVPAWSIFRVLAGVLLCFLPVTERNPERFDFLRPIDTFTRWVEAPIDVDQSCRSFFIKPASEQVPVTLAEHLEPLRNRCAFRCPESFASDS